MVDAEGERRQRGVENGWICVGAFAGSHGVHGDVRLKSFTDDPDAIFSYPSLHRGPNGPMVKVNRKRDSKEGFIVKVGDVSSREDAMALKGLKLYVPREALEVSDDDDEYYLADLIGLVAHDVDGTEIGFVRAVENYGADDLLELVLNTAVKGLGRHAFIPFRKVYVPEVDISGGRVMIAFAEWLKTQVSERDNEAETGEENGGAV